MKTPSVLAVLALGLAAVALVRALGAERGAPEPAVAAPARGASALRAEVEALREQNRALRDRVERLELEPPVEPVRRVPDEALATAEELAALREELLRSAGLTRGSKPPKEPAGDVGVGATPPMEETPVFQERVAEALEEIRVRETVEDTRRWAASRTRRMRERLPDVARELGLGVQQERALDAALVGYFESQGETKVRWVSGEVEADFDFETDQRRRAEAFLGELSGFLSPVQLEEYLELGDPLSFPGLSGGAK